MRTRIHLCAIASMCGLLVIGCGESTTKSPPDVSEAAPVDSTSPPVAAELAPGAGASAAPAVAAPVSPGLPHAGDGVMDAEDATADLTTPESLAARIQQLRNQQRRAGSREEFLNTNQSIFDLSQKLLALETTPEQRDQARSSALEAIALLTRTRPEQELLKMADKLAEEVLRDTPAGDAAATALFLRFAAHFNTLFQNTAVEPEALQELFEMADGILQKFPGDERSAMALYQFGEMARNTGADDFAKKAFRAIVDRDPSGPIAQRVAGTLLLMESIGKPVAIAGPTLDGSELDIATLKGKVVLVDFWATWCGPCVAELPNVQAVYEKYRDQGFEVVAVSFDNSQEKLSSYVAEKGLPWPQIYFDEDGKRGWQNPLGQKYGITAIPATFLIDREGNLRKVGVRGPALEPAVAELLQQAEVPVAN